MLEGCGGTGERSTNLCGGDGGGDDAGGGGVGGGVGGDDWGWGGRCYFGGLVWLKLVLWRCTRVKARGVMSGDTTQSSPRSV